MTQKKGFLVPTILALLLTYIGSPAAAQGMLDKKITLSIHQRPLAQVLTEIGKKGDFTFSYNTSILKGDSGVTIAADNMTIRAILDKLLGDGYDYAESGRYVIILQRAPPAPPKGFTISGYIKDEETQEKVSNVSVYENEQLVSTLTDTNGYFRLRLHDKYAHATLVISKQLYADTFVVLRSGVDQQLDLTISHAKVTELPTFVITNRVERTWFARFFLSSRQIIQSMNIMSFFANKPVQMSLMPRLGTHGAMGGQIVNKLSLNIIGGYTAGVNGVELAGVFNIDKKDAKGVQCAGTFNIVGGVVKGVQLAGINNHDLDSVVGVQAAGVINIARKAVHGVQISGIVNHTPHLHGVQIGLINIADTLDGVQIGLLNFVKHGTHRLTLSADEVFPINISYKVGGRKTYSILQMSGDPTQNKQAYAYGFGIGHILPLGNRSAVVFEGTQRFLYLGNWGETPTLTRVQAFYQVSLSKTISLFAGPAVSYYHTDKPQNKPGYKSEFPGTGYSAFAANQHNAGWVGWSVGINFF